MSNRVQMEGVAAHGGAQDEAGPKPAGAPRSDGADLKTAVLARKLVARRAASVQKKDKDKDKDKDAPTVDLDKKYKVAGAQHTYHVADHDVLCFHGDITEATVDVMLFFHGMWNDYSQSGRVNGIPSKEQKDKGDFVGDNGAIGAQLATAAKQRPNLVVLAPVAGAVGFAPWGKVAAGGFKSMADGAVAALAKDLGKPITAGQFSLVGHSGGGVALGQAAEDLGDSVTEVTLQDAGYGYTGYDPSFAKAADWLLAPSASNKTRTVRVFSKDKASTVDSADSTSHVLGYSDDSGFSRHALEQRVAAGKLPYSVHETIYESDATARSTNTRLESKIEIQGNGHLQGVVYVYRMKGSEHYDVRNTTAAPLAKGPFGQGDGFAATGPVKLNALSPGKYTVVNSKPLVRRDDDLGKPKLDDKKKQLMLPVPGPVDVTDFQHGPGYEVFAQVKDWGWTLYSNLQPAKTAP